MKVKQAIKKMVALAAGAGIVGATLASALAVDLADYPAPFVKDGVFADSVVVVGERAATSDVLGAIEIAASLQAAAYTIQPVTVEGATVDPTIDEGVEIKKSGDKLNYNEQLSEVQGTALDATDLPDVLGDGTYDENRGDNTNEVDYEQSITLGSGSNVGDFQFTQPDDMDAGDYLYIPDGQTVYTYTLEFDSAVEYDTTDNTADFEGSKISLQGHEYTITDAKFTSGDVLEELTLVAGDQTKWLQQDQPLTIGEHTVMVVNVDDSATKCGIEVDGVVKWVNVGSTDIVGGMSIGVLDAIAVHSKDYDQDTCEITIGSSELVLPEGDKVTVNGEEIDGSNVAFTSVSAEWTDMTITYESQDEEYLAAGEAWTDPVFGNFKILFQGTTKVTEEMSFETTGSDDAEFTFLNNDGKEVVVPFHYESSTLFLGEDTDEELLLPGDSVTETSVAEGTMLFYTTSGGEAHILEIKDIDTTNNQTDIDDLTYGSSWENKDYTVNRSNDISLGSLGVLRLIISSDGKTVTFNNSVGGGVIETSGGANLYFNQTIVKDFGVLIIEQDVTEVTANTLELNLTYDSGTDDRLELSGITGDTSLTWVDASEDDDNTAYAVTAKGTLLEKDAEDMLSVVVTYPEEEVYANVFVAPLTAKVTAGSSGSVNAEKINAIPVGMGVLDKDAEALTKNMIVVGGPCVNTIAAELAGNPASCAEGYVQGKAKLKLYTRNGKTALLVAGYSAQDSLGAAYVLADYEDHEADLTGSEVEVVVASLTDVTLNSVE